MTNKHTRILYRYCPLCRSANYKLIAQSNCRSQPLYRPELPEIINWQQCDDCGHIFTDGYFSEETTHLLLSNAHDYQLPGPREIEKFRMASAKIIDRISGVLGKQNGKWLDVGFGNGSLITTAEEHGFRPIGIDLRQAAVTNMQQYGYEAHHMDFLDYREYESLTVISMADVLEHMPYPRENLCHALKLLKPQGILFISCPNADSFLWRVFDQRKINPYWQEIEHFHNFGRHRLYALLSELEVKPVYYTVSERYKMGMEIISVKSV